MASWRELLPVAPDNRWQEVMRAWAALLDGQPLHLVQRRIAQQAMEEDLMPADVAFILGTTPVALEAYFLRGEPLELEDDAVVLLKRLLGLPAVAVRLGLGQLRLTDLMSAAALRRAQATLRRIHPRCAEVWEDEAVVAMFVVLGGRYGDVPGSERALLEP